MAFWRILVALAIVAVVVPKIVATDYIVGDDKGWTLNFDYQDWAKGKEFQVGDKLIFKYGEGSHNVMKVDGDGFRECTKTDDANTLRTGNDVIELKTPGKKWYICGVAKHCENGNMKLMINVLSKDGSTSPSTGTHSAATGIALSKYYAWVVGVFGIVAMIMV